METLNFTKRRSRVHQKLMSNIETVLRNWLEGEIKGGEYAAINPLRDDSSTGSFSIWPSLHRSAQLIVTPRLPTSSVEIGP